MKLRLRNARDKAVEASQIKTEILARTNHELQTPLGAILGYAEMVEAGVFGPTTPQQQEIMQKIIRRSLGLTESIRNLIDQASFQTLMNRYLHLKKLIPETLIAQMHRSLDPAAEAKGLKLTSKISPNFTEKIIADPHRVQQIIVNLVTNGIKFTNEGQIHVQLYKPTASIWAIEVADTGIGIPVDAQAYIFNPFRQADGSVTQCA